VVHGLVPLHPPRPPTRRRRAASRQRCLQRWQRCPGPLVPRLLVPRLLVPRLLVPRLLVPRLLVPRLLVPRLLVHGLVALRQPRLPGSDSPMAVASRSRCP
jgi:hypothetical protein